MALSSVSTAEAEAEICRQNLTNWESLKMHLHFRTCSKAFVYTQPHNDSSFGSGSLHSPLFLSFLLNSISLQPSSSDHVVSQKVSGKLVMQVIFPVFPILVSNG